MIPTDWAVVRRPADGELVGYLSPDGAPGLVLPRLLTGAPAGPSVEPGTARDLLTARGLSMLDRRWWCRLPAPVVDGTDAGAPQPNWTWQAVVLVEVSPDGCRVRLEFAPPEELCVLAVLPVPVGDLLREQPPAG